MESGFSRQVSTALSAFWGGGGLRDSVCFREIGWLFGAARGLETLDLGAECVVGFCYLV